MSRRWLWSLIALVVVAAGSYGWFTYSRNPQLPVGIVYGNGHIEATEVRLSAEVSGRVLEHELAEGAQVAAGQIVATLDWSTSREELRVIQGELAALLQSQSALDSQIRLWEHHIETARRRVARTRSLLAPDLASPSEEDAAEDALTEAEAQLEGLAAERRVLQGRIDSARARVRLAEDRLEKTEVEAPLAGTVLIRAVETGELVQAGQTLALIADLERLRLEIYLPGDVLGKVALGDAARVRVDAFPDRYFPAQITRIDDFAQFTPRDIHVPAERTRLVYGMTLTIDNAQGHLKPGMPADAWVRWDEALAWPDTLAVPRG
jgi:HlyD family secretion protein